MKMIILILLFAFSNLYAEDANNISLKYIKDPTINIQPAVHYPILGDRATTVGHLKINFDKMPGGQVTDPVTMNALSIGIGNRVEVGVIPWVYAFDNSDFFKYGVMVKYNFYKTNQFQMALGLSQIKALMQFDENKSDELSQFKYDSDFHQWWNYTFFSMNYTPVAKPYNFGITLKYTEVKTRNSMRGTYHYNNPDSGLSFDYPIAGNATESSYQNTLTFDSNYLVKKNHWVGLSLGTASLNSKLNVNDQVDEENGYSSRKRYVLGLSYIHRNKFWILQDPRISASFFEGDGINYGFSSTF